MPRLDERSLGAGYRNPMLRSIEAFFLKISHYCQNDHLGLWAASERKLAITLFSLHLILIDFSFLASVNMAE
jgi:hypothetical protein